MTHKLNEKKIKAKLYSYLYQDKKHFGAEFISQEKCKKYIPPNYIDIEDIKILLEIQNNKCYICDDLLNLDWEVGCKYQITVDRINGQNCHLKGNCLLACFYCNCRGYNNKRQCKKKCCEDKSNDIRKKKDVPKDEISKLLNTYNEKVNGNYTTNDNWVDYEGHPVESNEYDSETGATTRTFKTSKAGQDFLKGKAKEYDDMMEYHYPGYSQMSRRQRKNILPPNTGIGIADENDRCSGCARHDLSCRCVVGVPWF